MLLALNDTFPSPLPVVGALLVWIVAITGIVWSAKLAMRRQPIPWPSAMIVVGIFVSSLILVILADTRGIGDFVGPPSMIVLFPAMMLAGPFGAMTSSGTAGGSRASGMEHLAIAIASMVFWSLAWIVVHLVRHRLQEPPAESEKPTD